MRALNRVTRIAFLLSLTTLGASAPAVADETASAVFAGGCFWCVEEAFDAVEGVTGTTSGFTGGHVEDPSYEAVTSGGTGHYEAVKVEYDPEQVGYDDLLHVFWRNIDPLDGGGQFCDRGDHYRAALFPGTDAERDAAEASRAELEASDRFDEPIATEILERQPFYAAEDYHQDYHNQRPIRYRFYVSRCGRYDRLDTVWGDEARASAP